MAGSPIKRMRKAGITDPVTGEVIPFPYIPGVAELPHGWRHFSTAAKMEHLLGMNLTRVAEILRWPVFELDQSAKGRSSPFRREGGKVWNRRY